MYTLRTLRRSPLFTVSTVLTIAIGVGANTGAFSALHTLFLKPLPYPSPGRLVQLYETALDGKPRGVAEANLLDWRAQSTLFENMAVFQPRSFGLTRDEREPVTVIQTGMVMASFFPTIAVPPVLGRTFTEQEEIAEDHRLVLTDHLWRTLFAADPNVAGRKVFLNEEPYTITGVMPAGFEYPIGSILPDAFLPLSRRDYCCGRIGLQDAVARLKPGVTLEAARSELASLAAALAREYPTTNRGRSAGLTPLDLAMHGARREPLSILLAASGLLLLIACANVAGLMLARAFARRHEISIRIAIGARVSHLARQHFAEAAVLSLSGAACGLLAAKLVLRAVPFFLAGLADRAPLELEPAAFLFAFALALAVAFLLAAVPVLAQWRNRAGIRSPRHTVRSGLIAAQIALCLVLLLSAGLLLRSFSRLLATNPGFETAHGLRFGIGLPDKRYDTDEKMIAFHRDLQRRLSALPGIEAAGAATRLPLRAGSIGPGGSFQIAGDNIPVPQRPRAWTSVASPGYFSAMGIPLQEGRDFSWRDDQLRNHRVVIVNRTFARTFLQNRRALGTVLDLRGAQSEVIGVAGDTRLAGMDHEPVPEIFLSMSQSGPDGCVYVLRTRTADPALPKAIAAAVAQQDPRLERVSPTPLQLVMERSLENRKVAIQLIGAFGSLALLLTALGVYGIVAFRVAERSREVAIRIALGATPSDIRSLILKQAAQLALSGIAAGLLLFPLAARLLKTQLYETSPADPLALAIVLGTLLGVALLTATTIRTPNAASASLRLGGE